MNKGFATIQNSFAKGGTAYQAMYTTIYKQILNTMVQETLKQTGLNVTVTDSNVCLLYTSQNAVSVIL